MRVYLRNQSGGWSPYEGASATARMSELGISIGDGATIGWGVHVSDGATIGAGVTICDVVTIGAMTRIGDGAIISGGVRIGDGASIGAGAGIGAGVIIGVGARIGNGASVPRTATHHVMGPLGPEDLMLTGYRGSNGEIRAATGCFDGTVEEFESRVREDHGDTEHGVRYLAAAQALRSLVAELLTPDCELAMALWGEVTL